MIIGYYPGGGGNRFIRYMENQEFHQTGLAYDNIVSAPLRGKYLDADGQVENKTHDPMLLHCVNYDRIYQETGRSDIVIIKSDIKDSLCREWSIKGKYKPMFLPKEISDEELLVELVQSMKDPDWPEVRNSKEYKELPFWIRREVEYQFNKNKQCMSNTSCYNFLDSAYTAIIWHHNLYMKYPLDPGLGKLVDIDQDDSEFARVMRRELAQYRHNLLFNFAWEVYTTLGPNAPIITLFRESNLHNG